MKKMLLAFLLLVCCAAYAGDTLTRAQVYNFNIGDTFDYESFGVGGLNGSNGQSDLWFPSIHEFSRYIIQNQYYSLDSDTLFVIRQRAFPLPMAYDTLVLDSMSSFEIYLNNLCQQSSYTVDSNSKYNGRVANGEIFCLVEGGGNIIFCAGLGAVFADTANSDPDGGFYNDSTKLIYYAKGAETWGVPYYVANQSALVQYMPIPEECATWLRTVDSVYFDFDGEGSLQPYPNHLPAFQEKITSGDKIAYEGHTYVEMIYSKYDFRDNFASGPSLVGYYRNDTLNRKAYLYQTLSSTPSLTYDFSLAADDADGTVVSLGQLTVDGQLRTIWNLNDGSAYIEGIGGASSIYPISPFYFQIAPGAPMETVPGYLTFCICGQTYYSYDSSGSCNFLAVNEISLDDIALKIFPNPARETVNISLSQPLTSPATFEIFNQLGEVVLSKTLNREQSIVQYSISNLADDIYYWQLKLPEQILSTGKVVVVK